MDSGTDKAGVVFSALVVVMAIPFGIAYFRRRRELDQASRTTGMIFLIAAILDAIVNVVRKMGLMPDDATYWTLQFSLLALFWVMWFLFMRGLSQRKA
jgi:hypothetical protein